jgi:hypothetical protein
MTSSVSAPPSPAFTLSLKGMLRSGFPAIAFLAGPYSDSRPRFLLELGPNQGDRNLYGLLCNGRRRVCVTESLLIRFVQFQPWVRIAALARLLVQALLCHSKTRG